jgi:hypothetical protein
MRPLKVSVASLDELASVADKKLLPEPVGADTIKNFSFLKP